MAILTGAVPSLEQLYVARFLLGVAQAGFFPGIVLYLTVSDLLVLAARASARNFTQNERSECVIVLDEFNTLTLKGQLG